MAEFPKLTMTNKAIEMIAESQLAGNDLIITKVKIGDGQLADGADIKAMTDVVAARLVASMTDSKLDGGQVTLNFAISNSELEAGFFAREIGIFAKLGEAGAETLYAYTNAGNLCDWIPDKHTPIDSQIVNATIVVGNASNVVVNVSDKAFVTTKDLESHNTAADAHVDIRQAIENIDVSQDIQKHNTDPNAHALAHVLDVDDTVVPTSNHGALAAIMNNVANMLKKIKGDTDWKDNPAISLAAILGDFATNLSVTTDHDTGVFTCASLGITGLMAQNGYICLGKLFGGLILQWGTATVPTNSGVTVTFPIAFTQACFGAQADAVASTTWGDMSGNTTYAVCVNGVMTTSLRLGMVLAINTKGVTGSARWFAYGV